MRARPWRYEEHIAIGETRAQFIWTEAASVALMGQGWSLVDLSDNAGTVGVTSRGRSSVYPLNVILRRRAATEALTDIQILTTWVDTLAYLLKKSGCGNYLLNTC